MYSSTASPHSGQGIRGNPDQMPSGGRSGVGVPPGVAIPPRWLPAKESPGVEERLAGDQAVPGTSGCGAVEL